MSDSGPAVFLSYASQDVDAASRICEALRAAGIEVWFDKSELRGGDAWDAAIRRQIKACALFVPIISQTTHSRTEGYFRLEWKLAIDRSHLMSDDQAFFVPVVIDDTRETEGRVPEKFLEVQWSRLPGGHVPTPFVEHVARLLSDDSRSNPPDPAVTGHRGSRAAGVQRPAPSGAGTRDRYNRWLLVATCVAGIGLISWLAYLAIGASEKGEAPNPPQAPLRPTAAAAAVPNSPPAHSIAVLPFVNMSGDPKQEYFSDGLSEELLNSLATIPALQVAARTSSFSFKGKDAKSADIGRELNVGTLLEGSVRKDGRQVRITAQLIDATTGYHLWSKTYDRDQTSVLALQSEIATSVTMALKATLLPDSSSSIELGGTKNERAFDAYLRGEQLLGRRDKESNLARIAAFDEAIRIDPAFARAYVAKASALGNLGGKYASSAETHGYFEQARKTVEQAIALQPNLGLAHAGLSTIVLYELFDFTRSLAEMDRALALSPGDVRVLQLAARLYSVIGRSEEALRTSQRAVVLDPLNASAHVERGNTLYYARHFRAALEAFTRAAALDANLTGGFGNLYIQLGQFDDARKACDISAPTMFDRVCLAIADHKLGRTAEAQRQVELISRDTGDAAAYQLAEIYAQWGDSPKALDWLDTAYRLRDSGLIQLKVDPLLDPIRSEPRFLAIEQKLNFPA